MAYFKLNRVLSLSLSIYYLVQAQFSTFEIVIYGPALVRTCLSKNIIQLKNTDTLVCLHENNNKAYSNLFI